MKQRTGWLECGVGLFVLAAFAGLIFLGLQVSGLSPTSTKQNFTVYASFHNIGSLRPRARVTIAGTTVGHVTNIQLDTDSSDFRSKVTMQLDDNLLGKLGAESSVMIQTQGLLGDQYVAIEPIQIDKGMLKNGDDIRDAQDAIVLEKLIQQVISTLSSPSKSGSGSASASSNGSF